MVSLSSTVIFERQVGEGYRFVFFALARHPYREEMGA